ncbi:MAG TPA: NAD(P)H-hydrate dehydratase, partial [Thermoplasmataceae archaeon]|nr:NAD(P)H-hydrate dehydratase [Thermoplasmataceae archaeon]
QHFIGDSFVLMEKAGKSIATAVRNEFGTGRRITVVCGTGNNAGDGIVAASDLATDNRVSVCLVKGENSLKTVEARRAMLAYSGPLTNFQDLEAELESSDVVIDALLGYGISGTPRGEIGEAIDLINRSGKPVVAVDIPSGLGTQKSIRPVLTVTFFDQKEGMTSRNCGKILTDDLGIGPEFRRRCGPGEFVYFNVPDPESHKGMNGRVAMITGHTYYGSAVIAAYGAIKTGSDLVRVFTSKENISKISAYDPQIIVSELTEAAIPAIENSGSILIGPGNGKSEVLEILRSVKKWPKNLVLDAEAIMDFRSYREISKGASIILTPHKTEFRNAAGMEPDESGALEFSRQNGVLTILKGRRDIITDGNSLYYCEGGNPRMSMGGTGDLLAGIVASIVNKVYSPLRACCLASFINKRAGELCYSDKLLWYDISDMIEKIPEVFKLIRKYNIQQI